MRPNIGRIAKAILASVLAAEERKRAQRHGPGRRTLYTYWKNVRFGRQKVGNRFVILTGWWEAPKPPTRQRRRLEERTQAKVSARKVYGSTRYWRQIKVEAL